MDRSLINETAFDCFSGTGGFRVLTEPLGLNFVGFCEKDKYSKKLYQAFYNTEGEYFCNDAAKINTRKLPNFKYFFAGFPCQPFSIAGKRLGFKDVRGTAFFEIARICQDKKPKYIILENVPGLLSHENGRTFSTIIGVLSDIGYTVEWQILNSKFFGVPHDRNRVYIIGHLRKESGQKIFPLVRKTNKIHFQQRQNKKEIHNLAQTIKTKDYANWNGNYVLVKKVFNINPSGKGMNGNVYDSSGLCPTLTTNKGEGIKILDNYNLRRLTPLEGFRCQGFPDEIVQKAYELGISDYRLQIMIGNAVTATIPQEIIMKIRRINGV